MKAYATAAAVAATLVASTAQASVIYNWRQIEPLRHRDLGTTVDVTGRLVVSDEAFRQGRADLRWSIQDTNRIVPGTPVESFSMLFLGITIPTGPPPFGQPPFGDPAAQARFGLTLGGVADGFINARTSLEQATLFSDGTGTMTLLYASEFPGYQCFGSADFPGVFPGIENASQCRGRGIFVLDTDTLPSGRVPVPGTAQLGLASLLAGWLLRRRTGGARQR